MRSHHLRPRSAGTNRSAGAITLALDEALANVIRHAYANRADGLIEMECRETADGLEITVLDNGDARGYG